MFFFHETKAKYGLVRIGTLFENGAPQRQAVGTFEPGLKFVPLISAQLIIDTSINYNQFGLVRIGPKRLRLARDCVKLLYVHFWKS